jgi:hypothetical protein
MDPKSNWALRNEPLPEAQADNKARDNASMRYRPCLAIPNDKNFVFDRIISLLTVNGVDF